MAHHGDHFIHGTIHGITEVGTVHGLTADGMTHGIMDGVDTVHGLTADGTVLGLTVDGMTHSTMDMVTGMIHGTTEDIMEVVIAMASMMDITVA